MQSSSVDQKNDPSSLTKSDAEDNETTSQDPDADDVELEVDDVTLPGIYHSGFDLYLGDILLEGKTKMQSPTKDNGVTFALVGSSGAGKSTLLRKVFIDDVYGPRRDKDYIISIFTESPHCDAFEGLSKEVKVCGCGVSEDIINAMKEQNRHFDKVYNFVNLLDDCIHLRHMAQVEKMFLIDRNSNLTSAVSLQWANLIPKSIRTSVYYVFIMHHSNPQGAEVAVDTFLCGYIPGRNIKKKTQIFMTWARKHRFYFIDNLNEKCYAVTDRFMCKELPQIIDEDCMDPQQQNGAGQVQADYQTSSSPTANTSRKRKSSQQPTATKCKTPSTHKQKTCTKAGGGGHSLDTLLSSSSSKPAKKKPRRN